MFSVTTEELEAIEGVGPVVAVSMANFFGQDRNRKTVNDLITNGVVVLQENGQKEGPLEGKVFVLTGSLESLTRSEAKKNIESAGGKVVASVSRNTDYLVAGAEPGSKLARASTLGVEVIDEATLINMMTEK
jgi:DNA ligase (NAD+)